MKKNIVIIIPTYHEEENIFRLIKKLGSLKFDKDIIIVDDTPVPLNFTNLNFNKKKITYIHRGKKSGRGSAVIHGLKVAKQKKYDIFVEMDADFSHNPTELASKIKFFKKNSLDMLISSRYMKKSKIINWPLQRTILSKLSNFITRMLLPVPITDYTNGYRLYSKRSVNVIVNQCGKIGDGFIILSEILLRIYYKNYKISEIKTIFVNRKRGESSVSLSLIIESLFGLIKLYIITLKFKKDKL
tara:strand:- start:202 stop:930 length:729 start_codon:yes stop_codon:yes gene_type:complete